MLIIKKNNGKVKFILIIFVIPHSIVLSVKSSFFLQKNLSPPSREARKEKN